MPNNHWSETATQLRREADRLTAEETYSGRAREQASVLRDAAEVLEAQPCQHSLSLINATKARCAHCSVLMTREWAPADYDPMDDDD